MKGHSEDHQREEEVVFNRERYAYSQGNNHVLRHVPLCGVVPT
jgi:hypothetical protein